MAAIMRAGGLGVDAPGGAVLGDGHDGDRTLTGPAATDTSPIAMTWLPIDEADGFEHLPGEGAGGDPRGRFPRARALEHVAQVVVPVLQRAGEIGVARPGARHRRAPRPGGVGEAGPPPRAS